MNIIQKILLKIQELYLTGMSDEKYLKLRHFLYTGKSYIWRIPKRIQKNANG